MLNFVDVKIPEEKKEECLFTIVPNKKSPKKKIEKEYLFSSTPVKKRKIEKPTDCLFSKSYFNKTQPIKKKNGADKKIRDHITNLCSL